MKNGVILKATVFMIGVAFASNGMAAMRPMLKKRAGLPPFEVVKKIIRGNDQREPSEQSPLLYCWLADSNPGLTAEETTSSPAGKLIQVRNPEAIMTPEAIRLIDLAVNRLHLPVLLITRSSNSQYLSLISERPLPKDISGRKSLLEKAVDHSVTRALARYQRRVKKGRLVIIGSIFDQENWYGRGYGRLLVININGEKDPGRLMRHQATVTLSHEERRDHLGR